MSGEARDDAIANDRVRPQPDCYWVSLCSPRPVARGAELKIRRRQAGPAGESRPRVGGLCGRSSVAAERCGEGLGCEDGEKPAHEPVAMELQQCLVAAEQMARTAVARDFEKLLVVTIAA